MFNALHAPSFAVIASLAAWAAPASFADSARAESDARDTVTKTFDAPSVRSLHVSSASGAVIIRGTDARQANVTARKVRFQEGCVLRIDLGKDGALQVASKEPNVLLGSNGCEVEFTIDLPRAASIDLELGVGVVTLSGLRGAVDYELGSGNLTLSDVELSALDGKSGSGDVTLAGSVGETALKLGAGDARITFDKLPTTGRLDVKVGMGSATIKVPKDSRIRSNFKAGMGSLTNELGDSPDAKFEISGSAGAGDMTIRRL